MAGSADFDDDFDNAKAAGTGGTLKKEDLPDGDYEMDIDEVTVKSVKGAPLLVLTLQIVGDSVHAGGTLSHEYWYKSADGSTNEKTMAQLRKDLTTMGFGAEGWGKEGRRFSEEMPKCELVMPGMRLACRKKTNPSGNKTYHNLYLNKRLDDGKPYPIDAATLAELAAAKAVPADPFS